MRQRNDKRAISGKGECTGYVPGCALLLGLLLVACGSNTGSPDGEGIPPECDEYLDHDSDEPLLVTIRNTRQNDILLREYGGCNDTPSILRAERRGVAVQLAPSRRGVSCREFQRVGANETVVTTDCSNPRLSRLRAGETRELRLRGEYVTYQMPRSCAPASSEAGRTYLCYSEAPLNLNSLEIAAQALIECSPDLLETSCDDPTPALNPDLRFEPVEDFMEVLATVESGSSEVVLRF